MFNRRKPEEPKPPEPALEIPALPETTPTPDDNGLDLPSYRSAPFAPPIAQKETAMARSPFTPALPPTSALPARPVGNGPAPARDTAERRTLVVGRGISVQGTVQDAERLVVEGTMEAAMINGLVELSISQGGIFKGEVEVDEAEVGGTIDGTLTARNALVVRSTGRVLGTARCRRLQVEDGGQITGRIEMLGDSAPPPPSEI